MLLLLQCIVHCGRIFVCDDVNGIQQNSKGAIAKCGCANILWQQINCTVGQLNVIVFNWRSSCGFLCHVMVKNSKIMEEYLTTTACRETKEDYHQPTNYNCKEWLWFHFSYHQQWIYFLYGVIILSDNYQLPLSLSLFIILRQHTQLTIHMQQSSGRK